MPSAISDWNLRRHGPKPWRRAMASSATKPILWRLVAYFRPGLPSPTMSSMTPFPSGAGSPATCYFFFSPDPLAGCAGAAAAAAGPGNGRDGEIAIGDHRAHIRRQLDVADMDRAADLPAGEIDLDLLRDAVGRAIKLDLVAHDVEDAA